MNCPSCQGPIRPELKFCPQCGKPVPPPTGASVHLQDSVFRGDIHTTQNTTLNSDQRTAGGANVGGGVNVQVSPQIIVQAMDRSASPSGADHGWIWKSMAAGMGVVVLVLWLAPWRSARKESPSEPPPPSNPSRSQASTPDPSSSPLPTQPAASVPSPALPSAPRETSPLPATPPALAPPSTIPSPTTEGGAKAPHGIREETMEETFKPILLGCPNLLQSGGAAVVEREGRRYFMAVGVTEIREPSPSEALRQLRVGRINAQKEAVAYLDGTRVTGEDKLTEKKGTRTTDGRSSVEMVETLDSTTLTAVRGQLKELPKVGTWKNAEGTLFFLVLGKQLN